MGQFPSAPLSQGDLTFEQWVQNELWEVEQLEQNPYFFGGPTIPPGGQFPEPSFPNAPSVPEAPFGPGPLPGEPISLPPNYVPPAPPLPPEGPFEMPPPLPPEAQPFYEAPPVEIPVEVPIVPPGPLQGPGEWVNGIWVEEEAIGGEVGSAFAEVGQGAGYIELAAGGGEVVEFAGVPLAAGAGAGAATAVAGGALVGGVIYKGYQTEEAIRLGLEKGPQGEYDRALARYNSTDCAINRKLPSWLGGQDPQCTNMPKPEDFGLNRPQLTPEQASNVRKWMTRNAMNTAPPAAYAVSKPPAPIIGPPTMFISPTGIPPDLLAKFKAEKEARDAAAAKIEEAKRKSMLAPTTPPKFSY